LWLPWWWSPLSRSATRTCRRRCPRRRNGRDISCRTIQQRPCMGCRRRVWKRNTTVLLLLLLLVTVLAMISGIWGPTPLSTIRAATCSRLRIVVGLLLLLWCGGGIATLDVESFRMNVIICFGHFVKVEIRGHGGSLFRRFQKFAGKIHGGK